MKVPKPAMVKIDMSTVPRKNYGGSRPASQVTQTTFHHVVGDAAGAIAEMQKYSRTMSFSYTISSKGVIYQACGVGTVAYCDGNLASNKRSISIEHAGGIASVPYTTAMYNASIKLNAWLIDSLGINSFKRHRDVSDIPTGCPGKLDVERIVSGAKKLRAKYKEMEMVTLEQQTVLYRLYLGMSVTETGKKNVGKRTFAQERKRLMESLTYKDLKAQADAGKLNCKVHLPKDLRV